MYRDSLKPFFDRLFAFLGLLIAFLPIVILSILLRIKHGKDGVFFKQLRPGKNEKLFYLVKFKTMTDKRDIAGNLLPDAERLTGLGKFIRKTSLDELPQLWNVLMGDMSLVGPRPLLVQYLLLYNDEQRRRHLVKPGITGWAQVNGRNAISWERKFELDVWYVENLSFWLDCRILILTLKKVLKKEGISAYGHETVDAFIGSES